jgi:Tol biopolymer transport system component
LTLDPSLNQVRVWSPDGKKIAFTSNRTPFNRVFEKNAKQLLAPVVFTSEVNALSPRFRYPANDIRVQ